VRSERYVGRLEESERVRRSWQAVGAGERQAVLVSGEPGIGKTRLASQSALEFHRDGAAILFGHCADEVGGPYAAWTEALSPLVDHLPDRALAGFVDRHGGELTRLVPALARRMPDAPAPTQTDPETERYGCDRRTAQRSSWIRIRLAAGSRTAQSRTPYGCSVGSWTTSAPLACTRSKVPSRSLVARLMAA
jgi:hypothetical protein